MYKKLSLSNLAATRGHRRDEAEAEDGELSSYPEARHRRAQDYLARREVRQNGLMFLANIRKQAASLGLAPASTSQPVTRVLQESNPVGVADLPEDTWMHRGGHVTELEATILLGVRKREVEKVKNQLDNGTLFLPTRSELNQYTPASRDMIRRVWLDMTGIEIDPDAVSLPTRYQSVGQGPSSHEKAQNVAGTGTEKSGASDFAAQRAENMMRIIDEME
ncbi:hypothetical protein FPJ27_15640 [Burkholderia sp. MS455]|uniref:hypothetical protein n=1 Tax=Burkholderia sp. MS455 TaxID=2811788 RepID=UPI00195D9B27|nr:hypothetical protein [Burkholderia sp. MS455]QRR07691.1 hypothetical protein FPJ27_15640 [Burkholderia sp. MS455]